MAKITPEIVVSNLAKSQEFFETLGFVKDNEGIADENGLQWISMEMAEAHVWLLRQDVDSTLQQGVMRGNGVHLYLSVDDVDGLYEALKTRGLQPNIVQEIETMWYGLREFKVADPDGYVWTINTPVSEDAAESTGEEGQAAS